MSVLCIIMPPGVAPVYNCFESWARFEELSIASIFKQWPGFWGLARLTHDSDI